MAIIIKSKDEREKMRESGHIVAEILAELRAAVRPGITTDDIDALAVAALKERGAKSSSLGYRQGAYRYPASLCTSVNDEIVHGIPGKRELQEGDARGNCKKAILSASTLLHLTMAGTRIRPLRCL